MNGNFLLSCESTVDLNAEWAREHGISVLSYTYTAEGEEYEDAPRRGPEDMDRFYALLDQGKMPSTTQINAQRYLEYFRSLPGDVLHICFGTGMTGSYYNAVQAVETLKEEEPDRRVIVIDSLCSCCGYGLLTDAAARLKEGGASLEETEAFVLSRREKVHHQLFSTDLRFFRRSGRVSGPAAAIGTVLGICPLMRLNKAGRIVAYGKVRGKKKAMEETLKWMLTHAEGGAGYSGRVFLSHSRMPDTAEEMAAAIAEAFPNLEEPPRVYEIGPVIASHCGPGTLAIYFFGDERPE